MDKIFREIKHEIQFERSDNISFPAHIHEYIELVLVLKGSCVAYCDGKKYILSENSFFLAFPNQVHHYSDSLKGDYLLLIVKPSDLLSYSNVFDDGAPISALWKFEKNEDDNMSFLLETALNEYKRDGYSTVIQAYLTTLFGKLLSFYKIEKCRASHDTVLRILQYCISHYKEPITINSVAHNLKISRSLVSHIFSSRISLNFCDYINSLRLKDAIHLLKNKNYSITEISYMSGFPTIRTFNRAFLKQYGTTPSSYRKKIE